ncbi:hypothetical protein EDD16DRAFT_1559582, partial [Pisolithus croceorrhizus]
MVNALTSRPGLRVLLRLLFADISGTQPQWFLESFKMQVRSDYAIDERKSIRWEDAAYLPTAVVTMYRCSIQQRELCNSAPKRKGTM